MEIIRTESAQLPATQEQWLGMFRQMLESQQAMAQEIEQLRRSVQLLTKVTPAQAAAINRAMRERAEALSARYRIWDIENHVTLLSNCIRRDVRFRAGISSIKELPRCECEAYLHYIEMWDDYKAVRALREKAMRRVGG